MRAKCISNAYKPYNAKQRECLVALSSPSIRSSHVATVERGMYIVHVSAWYQHAYMFAETHKWYKQHIYGIEECIIIVQGQMMFFIIVFCRFFV